MLNRHQIREKLVFVLYQHLLLKKDLYACFNDNFEDQVDDFSKTIINDISNNIDTYISDISSLLKGWSFDRLNYVDQGILIVAASEISLNINDKAIAIDEAVRLCKTYSDEESFKYVNGVLDKL